VYREELAQLGFDPAGLPLVVPATAEQAAPIVRTKGYRLELSGGVLWRAFPTRRMWLPVDSLQPLPAEQVRPPRLRLGYVAAVSGAGNNVLPVELFTDLDRLSLRVQVTRSRRYSLRQGFRGNEFGVGADLVRQQGWAIMSDAHARINHRTAAGEQAFRQEVTTTLETPGGFLISGWGEGRLRGFAMGYVIGENAYLIDVCINDEGRATRVGAGLYWLLLCTMAATPGLRRVHFGPYFPENPKLHYFKHSFGVRLHAVPALGRLNPVAARWLKSRQPAKYVRLGGADVRTQEQVGVPPAGTSVPLPWGDGAVT
jgi:uncharacterized protein YifN (PemK superfamily)